MPRTNGQSTDINLLQDIRRLNLNNPGNSYNSSNIALGLLHGGLANCETVCIQSSRIAGTTESVNSGAIPLNSLDHTVPSSATTLVVASTDTTDTITGAGAEVIRIFGLNADYEPIFEDVVLTGQTRTTATTQSFLRINDLLVLRSNNAANDTKNVGIISVNGSGDGHTGAGLPTGVVFATIEIGQNKASLGIYTVKAGYSFKSTHYKVTADVGTKKLNSKNLLKFLTIPEFKLVDLTFASNDVGFVLDGIPNIPEKTDITIRSSLSTGTGRVVIWWSGILYRHNSFPNAQLFNQPPT